MKKWSKHIDISENNASAWVRTLINPLNGFVRCCIDSALGSRGSDKRRKREISIIRFSEIDGAFAPVVVAIKQPRKQSGGRIKRH